MSWATKGKSHPHTPEWEANRVLAIRKWAANRKWPRGYKRPKQHTDSMIKARDKYRKENPEAHKRQCIKNLPKNCVGSKNGNWRGGITAIKRGFRWSKEYKQWRKTVIQRDGLKCKICGCSSGLQVHHIISVSECAFISELPMNGVVLCKKHHYENDEVWRGKRPKQMVLSGKPLALIFTIPHEFQTYPTVGNWQFTKDGTVVIFVSRLPDSRMEQLVALHELVEVLMCKHDGVTTEEVDAFDKKFEAERAPDNEDEPGDEPAAPYSRQHCIATGIERILAAELCVSWKEYEEELNGLP